MRVLSISTLFPNPPKPSFGVFVGNQMRGIVARGEIDLVMISPLGIPPWPLSLREPYRTLAAIPASSDAAGLPVRYPRFPLIPRIGGDGNPARIVRAVLPLARRLHAEKPFDLVDAQFFFPDGPAAAAIARDLGLPLTIKARGADVHYWGSRPGALAQILPAANQAALLLTVSEALGRDMAAIGMPPGRIRVHYTGLDRDRFHPIDRAIARAAIAADPALAIPDDGPLIVTPGALIPRKGQRFVIDALRDIPGARLVIAGAGEDAATLRARAAEAGLAGRVQMAGIVLHDVLPTLLSAANVMVLPSASEGLANVWVEALGCGTPIVITNAGGAAEVVNSPAAGRIVDRSAAAIADAVNALLAAPPTQGDVAQHAERFSWEENARLLASLWREAAGL